MNLYTYVDNSPYRHLDPYGHKITCISLGGSAEIFVGVSGAILACKDDAVPPHTGTMICLGGGVGIGAGVAIEGSVGTGFLEEGWTSQIHIQGGVGPISGGVATWPIESITGEVGIGIGGGGGGTLENCYTWLDPPPPPSPYPPNCGVIPFTGSAGSYMFPPGMLN